MNGLREKIRNKKGFTLVEMLIVVAIIAILIAVSIPLVSNALEKARDATDQANERAAKAEVLLVFLSGGKVYTDGTATTGTDVDAATSFGNGTTGEKVQTAYYDAASGRLVSTLPKKGYGQCTDATGKDYEGLTTRNAANTDKVLKVTCSADGIVGLSWVERDKT